MLKARMRRTHIMRGLLAALVTYGFASPIVGSARAAPAASSVPTKRPPDRERGRELYLLSCWQCHGTEGKGDGPAATALVGGVPSLLGAVSKDKFDALIKVIEDGKGSMPAYNEDIDKHDARRILLYVEDALQGRTEARGEKGEKDKEKTEDAEPQN
ncbi:MAG: cytochrome c [Myxococcales bacterium]|nr:cytochrome c [Myxococcales bacterium]